MKKHVYFLLFILLSLVLMAGCGSSGGGNGGNDKNPPSATTESASSITTTSVELKGSVDPKGLATDCWFKYGESSSALTNSTPKDSISGSSSHAHIDTISGLKPATTYYYQLIASNSDGTDEGEIIPFETLSDSIIEKDTPGYDQLGAGYDVFTAYANTDFVGNKVLDLDALNRDGKLSKYIKDKYDVKEHNGATITDYISELSISAGLTAGYKFFSGSINTTYSKMDRITTDWSFASVHIRHLVNGLHVVKMQSKDLKNYLLQEAKYDINNLATDDLFDYYGTHVIGKLVVGGRLDYNFSALITNKEQRENIGVYAKFKLDNKITSISGEIDVDIAEEVKEYVEDENYTLTSIGGQGTASEVWKKDDYTKWVDTVQNNPVFCDFSEDPWLIPIWELADGDCGEGSRCDEIKKAYEIYADGKTITIPEGRKRLITQIEVKNSGRTKGVTPTFEYHALTNLDGKTVGWVNEDNDKYGDYVYITYKEEWSDQADVDPIVGLQVDRSSWGGDVDLNSGTCLNMAFECILHDPIWGTCLTRKDTPYCKDSNPKHLYLHYTRDNLEKPISCIVLGDDVAIKDGNDKERVTHIYWGPVPASEEDAIAQLGKIQWVRESGNPLNVNEWARDWRDAYCVGSICFAVEANVNVKKQYIGYCVD